jgi:hypothetical protein
MLGPGRQMSEQTVIPVSELSHYIIDVIGLGWLSAAIRNLSAIIYGY